MPGDRGKCRTRFNENGRLKALNYGRIVAAHVDPIEKKPFYHFLPQSQTFSIATSGCPLHCRFCQNWQISQSAPEDFDSPFTPPQAITQQARKREAPIIAFTYNEPTVFFEYLMDVAQDSKKAGLKSVLVSCGFMNQPPLEAMCEVLDAIKIDLKGFSPDFYRTVCDAELEPVLRSIKTVARRGVHLEIVNLVVPTLNDSAPMLKRLAAWILDELGPDVPLHFTRFHPDYKLRNLPPTPEETLGAAREMAMEMGLHYVFVGNVPGHPGNHTYCPKCGRIVIERQGFFVTQFHLEHGKCPCGQPIAGVFP